MQPERHTQSDKWKESRSTETKILWCERGGNKRGPTKCIRWTSSEILPLGIVNVGCALFWFAKCAIHTFALSVRLLWGQHTEEHHIYFIIHNNKPYQMVLYIVVALLAALAAVADGTGCPFCYGAPELCLVAPLLLWLLLSHYSCAPHALWLKVDVQMQLLTVNIE